MPTARPLRLFQRTRSWPSRLPMQPGPVWLRWLGWALCLTGLLVTVLPILPTDAWWVRMWEFPRIQLALWLTAGLVALALAAPRDGQTLGVVAAVALALAWHLGWVYRYTTIVTPEARQAQASRPERTFRMIIANVRMDSRGSDDLLALVRREDPDVVLLLEPDRWWQQRMAPLRQTHPHAIEHPLDNTYGILLFSRLKLHRPQVRFLIDDDVPSVRADVELPDGRRLALWGVHPRPPVRHDTARRDAELLLVGKEMRQAGLPGVVAGDLNDVAWSPTTRRFQQISRALDPRVGRGFFATFPTWAPGMRYPLDHVFYDAQFRLVDLRRLDDFGSDHFPMLIALTLEDGTGGQQARPPDTPAAREKADKVIEQGRQAPDQEGP